MKTKKLFFYLISIIFLFGFGEIAGATDASVYVLPGSGELKENKEYTVSVIVEAIGEEVIGAVEGNLNLSKNLVCQSVSWSNDEILASSPPSCSNLTFALGIKGGTTSKKTLFTVKVKTASSGNANANLSIDKVAGKKLLDATVSNGSYTIISSCVCGDWESWQSGNCNEGGCDKKRVYIRTRSCEPAGCSAGSETKCVEDSACVPKPETKITIAAPTELSGYFNADNKTILISWKASPAKDISGYFILRKLSSEAHYKLIGTVSATALNYKDDLIKIEKTYDYSVVAFKGRSWDNSARSEFSTKTTISAKKVKEEIKEEEPEEIEIEKPKEEKYSASILPLEIEESKTPWLSFFGLAFAFLSIGGLVYYWKWQNKKLNAQKETVKLAEIEKAEKIEKTEENDIIDLRKFKK